MDILYREGMTAEEVNRLREAIGFRRIAPAQLEAGLRGSSMVLAARRGDEAVGMARLLWDGGAVALITDVIVGPDCRDQGLEQALVGRLLDFLRGRLQPGFGIQVDVRAWGRQEAVYAGMGFQPSVRERRGLPMHICLTDQIEITDGMVRQGD